MPVNPVVSAGGGADLTATDAAIADVQADVGNPSVRTNFQTLEAMLGLPDAVNSSLDDMLRTGMDSSAVSANLDGSILEVLNYIIENMGGTHALVSTVGTDTQNWNTQTGSSGESGEDLVTIGANDTDYILHSLLLDVSACTNGAVISVKLFTQINGVERKVYDQNFTIATDTDGLWIVNGSVSIHEALRVEIESDTSESVAIAYDYSLESMT